MSAPSTHVIHRTPADIKAAWEYSQQMHVPIVMMLGNITSLNGERAVGGCVFCTKFHNNVLISDEFKTWLRDESPYLWIEGGCGTGQQSEDYQLVSGYIREAYLKCVGEKDPGGQKYVIVVYYWNRGDGKDPVFRMTAGNSSHTENTYTSYPTWSDYRAYLQGKYDIDSVVDKAQFEPPLQSWLASQTMQSNVRNLEYDSAAKKFNAVLYNGHWDWEAMYGGRLIENLAELYFGDYVPTPPPEDTKFGVTFVDWDGKVLRETQQVAVGEDADPPPDPARSGYAFSGWQPSYTDVQCDTTCVAQYTKDPETKKYASPRTVTSISYDTTAMAYSEAGGTRGVTITDNVDNYSMVGSAGQANAISSDLLSVEFGGSVTAVGPSCFAGCKALTDAVFPPGLRVVKDYAFAGCSSLSSVSMLDDGASFCEIGSHAFDGCDSLESVSLNLSGTNRSTFILDHAFANCGNLRSAKWTNSSYLASYMFEGCGKLSSLQLNRYTSYVYPYCLAGIPSIRSITIPNSIWFLNEGMFQGDASLEDLTIEDTQQYRSVMNQVGANVFSGCRSLTAVTLPQSINALSCVSEAMLSGSSVQRVTFSGLPDEVFCTNYSEDRTAEYPPSALYTDRNDVAAVIQACRENSIPIVLIQSRTGKSSSGSWLCSVCAKFHKNVLDTQYFKDWLAGNDKYFFAFGDYDKLQGDAY